MVLKSFQYKTALEDFITVELEEFSNSHVVACKAQDDWTCSHGNVYCKNFYWKRPVITWLLDEEEMGRRCVFGSTREEKNPG